MPDVSRCPSRPAFLASTQRRGVLRDITPDQVPSVPSVPVAVDGKTNEEPRDVSLHHASDEWYCLWVQERLPWLQQSDGSGSDSEQLFSALVEHAREVDLQLQRGVSAADALKLALDVAHKTAWRFPMTTAGSEIRRERMVQILAAAVLPEIAAWRNIGDHLSRISDSGLKSLLEGRDNGLRHFMEGESCALEESTHPSSPQAMTSNDLCTGKLILFEILEYEEQKFAEETDGQGRERISLETDSGSLLPRLLDALNATGDTSLGAAISRAHATARALAFKPQAALARGAGRPSLALSNLANAQDEDEAWFDVEMETVTSPGV